MRFKNDKLRGIAASLSLGFILAGLVSIDTGLAGGDNLYWGDLHCHTELSSDAIGNIFNVLIYARDSSRLDFVGITDHDYILGRRLQDFQWSQLRSACAAFNQDGRFVTFSGYEWTSPVWGHICVHYTDDDQPFYCHKDPIASDPRKLLMLLDTNVTFIHYAHPTNINVDWWNWNSDILIGAEVIGYNQHIFEYYGCPGHAPDIAPNSSIQDILKAGYKIGLIGVSDTHIGKPGTGGLTAVYAESLSRSSISRALKRRRFYATTGERIVLDFSINGHRMGDIFQATGQLEINYDVRSPTRIGAIEIVKNNRILRTILVNNTQYSGTIQDTISAGNACYYLRVNQFNGHKAWSSPIWVKSSNVPPDTFSHLVAYGRDGVVNILGRNNYPFSWTKSYDRDFGDAIFYTMEWWEEKDGGEIVPMKSDTIWGTTFICENKLEVGRKYICKLKANDGWGGVRSATPEILRVRTVFWEADNSEAEFGFISVHPNPMSSQAVIDLFSKKPGRFKFSIYNILGEEVESRMVTFSNKGVQTINWNPSKAGRKLSQGLYFASLGDGRNRVSTRIMLLR